MSIGASEKPEVFETTISDRANIAVKKLVSSYFKDPIGNLFYFSLAIAMFVLLCGVKIRFEFYIILAILGLIEGYKFYLKRCDEGHIIINEEKKP